MLFTLWNYSLLAVPLGILCLTKGSQPRFHAVIMLCTGILGMLLPNINTQGTRLITFTVYIFFNFIILALSPLQLILVWYLSPKAQIDPGIVIHHDGDEKGNITVE